VDRPDGSARDRGSASVWVLAAGLLAVLVASAVATEGAAIVARHRAQAAADLAALAAAAHGPDGPGPACDRAGVIAAANGARLVGCRVDGLDVVVVAEVVPAGAAGLAGTARASARAGPVDASVHGWPGRRTS
jgi:secretion/DNA translocation related TadE-like protein